MSNITIIGTGNVASHLCRIFAQSGHVVHLYGRNQKEVNQLTQKFDLKPINQVKNIPESLIFLCVSDDAISLIANELSTKLSSYKIVHCSGSVSIAVLQNFSDNYGVFYPLQSFTKGLEVDFSDIPICITANNQRFELELVSIANDISSDVRLMTDDDRKKVHLGAVISNNFTNHLLSLVYDYCQKEDLPYDIYQSLMKETIRKGFLGDPNDMQTGPAARNDEKTISSHIEQLHNSPNIKELYQKISDSIKNKTQ